MRKVIFEKSSKGIENSFLPDINVDIEDYIDKELLSEGKIGLPEVGEQDIVRHYINLSKLNFSVDNGMYPLGSCTMKYNPKINEEIAAYREFTNIHPYFPIDDVQGMMEILYKSQEYFKDISGLSAVTLLPSAGAHGELAGNFIIAKYFKDKGENRTKMLIPDSAHGTNPASAFMAGFTSITIHSDKNGDIDIDDLKANLDNNVAGIMMTQPNTLGIFDSHFTEIANLIHSVGGIVYMDGANMNAMLCHVQPGKIGADIMHFNLHKTFSTPHGMGGPGSGPVAVVDFLSDYLPIPVVERNNGNYYFNYDLKNTIGSIKEGYGNVGVVVKSLVYMMALGREGLKEATDIAVLNANYIKESLKDYYHLEYPGLCKHECVFDNSYQKENGIKTLDIAKRLLDYGFHAPTIYFPLIVHEAMMIEPTETESKETLDNFIEVMKKIAREAKENPEILKNAPNNTPVRRLDNVAAARHPILRWEKEVES
jgi:glycine dehydrogenase subunit 2